MVEYNGMWTLDTLYTNMPKEWIVAQEFLFIDARTFLNYNNNMRQLMVDKLQSCELAVLNRFPRATRISKCRRTRSSAPSTAGAILPF